MLGQFQRVYGGRPGQCRHWHSTRIVPTCHHEQNFRGKNIPNADPMLALCIQANIGFHQLGQSNRPSNQQWAMFSPMQSCQFRCTGTIAIKPAPALLYDVYWVMGMEFFASLADAWKVKVETYCAVL